MLHSLEAYAEHGVWMGYTLLFAGVLLENAALPVPGETIVLIAGFLASPGSGAHLRLDWVILLTIVAALIGNNIAYWLGYHCARPRLREGGRFLILTPRGMRGIEGYFQRYGLWTIFFSRFVVGLRVISALAAGTAGMPYGSFLLANVSGAVVWSFTIALLGYFFGHSLRLLEEVLDRGSLIVLGLAVLLAGAVLARKYLPRFRLQPDNLEAEG
ncbi:MAG: DedA family protein [Gemmataceae bacterium]